HHRSSSCTVGSSGHAYTHLIDGADRLRAGRVRPVQIPPPLVASWMRWVQQLVIAPRPPYTGCKAVKRYPIKLTRIWWMRSNHPEIDNGNHRYSWYRRADLECLF